MATLPDRPADTLDRAIENLRRRQQPDGAWHGDYSGPQFLLPLYVAAARVAEWELDEDTREGMLRYLRWAQNRDGGFGLGIENPSCVFTSVLNYVAARMLGAEAHEAWLVRCRTWFLERGGATASASWGRFVLAVLNLQSWEGLEPIPPELWLLPRSAPIHPGRMWCHARMVYMPMSWLYGARASIEVDDLILALREEIHDRPWGSIRWAETRETVAPEDAWTPRDPVLRVANRALHGAERVVPRWLRRRALDEVLEQIRYEDEITHHLCIGPVNKAYNTMVWAFVDRDGPELRRHLERLPDYLHRDAHGVRMNGYNHSRLWDTAFGIHALIAAGGDADDVLEGALGYVVDNRIPDDPPDRQRHYRCRSKGGWPFSDIEHGWPITDCTSEGLRSVLALRDRFDVPFDDDDLAEAVDRILEWQNPDGGWASYERTRGPAWLERLNPSDIFGGIMIEYSYVECTSACLQALDAWRRREGATPEARVDDAIERGLGFLLGQQRADGSWFGSWGVCFTYGTWFGIAGLRAAGLPSSHPAIQRAADFLERIQLADGGWGEDVESCRRKELVTTDESQAVMTSWALLGLVDAGRVDTEAVRRGVAFLEARQDEDGGWPEERVAGVFNRTCAIVYDNYRDVFPVWALGKVRGESRADLGRTPPA